MYLTINDITDALYYTMGYRYDDALSTSNAIGNQNMDYRPATTNFYYGLSLMRGFCKTRLRLSVEYYPTNKGNYVNAEWASKGAYNGGQHYANGYGWINKVINNITKVKFVMSSYNFKAGTTIDVYKNNFNDMILL